MKDWISEAGEDLLSLIFPENLYCISCGELLDPSQLSGLCPKCREEINWTADNPYRYVMDSLSLDDIWTCCRYGGRSRRIMNGLKLSGKTYLAENLGLLLAEKAQAAAEEKGLDLKNDLAGLVPVPMFKEKEKDRGYNQAALLAKKAGKVLGLRVLDDVLIKSRESASMRFSSGMKRRLSLDGCFEINKEKRAAVEGARLILIDDVCTTAATADCCASVLKEAGAEEVILLCFASADG